MKKFGLYLVSLIAVPFLVTACGSGDDEGDNTPGVYSQSVTIPAEISTQQVALDKLNAPIEAISVLDSWLTVEKMSYSSGNPVVKLSATSNPNTSERRTKVVIIDTSQNKVELTVIQKTQTSTHPEDNTPGVYSQSVTIPAEVSTQQVALDKLNTSIEEIAVQANWLTIEKMPYSSGNPVVKLSAISNPNTTERRTKVVIVATSQDKVELTVIQKARPSTPSDDSTIDETHDVVTDQPAYVPSRR